MVLGGRRVKRSSIQCRSGVVQAVRCDTMELFCNGKRKLGVGEGLQLDGKPVVSAQGDGEFAVGEALRR